MNPFDLRNFEPPPAFTKAMLSFYRPINTIIDTAFYDVAHLVLDLLQRRIHVHEMGNDRPCKVPALQHLSLDAATNPEGSILVINSSADEPLKSFADAQSFMKICDPKLTTIVIAGVGSSAVGAAAFAWDVSEALGEPVAAIVAGYGVADVLSEALGGWYGFGMQQALRELIQNFLSDFDLKSARIGRNLLATARGCCGKHDPTFTPKFDKGSPEADVLHEILMAEKCQIRRIVGHSKGVLNIDNALREVNSEILGNVQVLTLGCAIHRTAPTQSMAQYLGSWDWLGIMNSWGHVPDWWMLGYRHTTNSLIPGALPVKQIVRHELTTPAPSAPPPAWRCAFSLPFSFPFLALSAFPPPISPSAFLSILSPLSSRSLYPGNPALPS